MSNFGHQGPDGDSGKPGSTGLPGIPGNDVSASCYIFHVCDVMYVGCIRLVVDLVHSSAGGWTHIV